MNARYYCFFLYREEIKNRWESIRKSVAASGGERYCNETFPCEQSRLTPCSSSRRSSRSCVSHSWFLLGGAWDDLAS